MSEVYIDIINEMCKDSTTRVVSNRCRRGREQIRMEVGLHQGSVLSPLLLKNIKDVITEYNGEDRL